MLHASLIARCTHSGQQDDQGIKSTPTRGLVIGLFIKFREHASRLPQTPNSTRPSHYTIIDHVSAQEAFRGSQLNLPIPQRRHHKHQTKSRSFQTKRQSPHLPVRRYHLALLSQRPRTILPLPYFDGLANTKADTNMHRYPAPLNPSMQILSQQRGEKFKKKRPSLQAHSHSSAKENRILLSTTPSNANGPSTPLDSFLPVILPRLQLIGSTTITHGLIRRTSPTIKKSTASPSC